MTKDERSLLLYLETRAVDHHGAVDTIHINDADRVIVDRWASDGYIRWGRIYSKNAMAVGCSQWVRLSSKAMADAHAERSDRADRMFAKSFEAIGYEPEEAPDA